MPSPQYNIQSLTLAALGSVAVDYEFQPDEIVVTAEEVIITGIDIFPTGAQGAFGLAMRAQGPVVFPGLQRPQHVRFVNLDAVPHVLRVVAQQGLAPTSITTPTTLTNPYAGVGMIDVTGWVEHLLAWTWVSTAPDRFSCPGDVTLIFRKGTKVRYKQGGPFKYGYVLASSFAAGATTITISGGTDYILINAAISNGAYSHIENPQEFPDWFNYTPTFAGWGAMTWGAFVVAVGKFNVDGRKATFVIHARGTTGGVTNLYLTATFPFSLANFEGAGGGRAEENDLEEACGITINALNQVRVSTHDGTNWFIGVSTGFAIVVVGEL